MGDSSHVLVTLCRKTTHHKQADIDKVDKIITLEILIIAPPSKKNILDFFIVDAFSQSLVFGRSCRLPKVMELKIKSASLLPILAETEATQYLKIKKINYMITKSQ